MNAETPGYAGAPGCAETRELVPELAAGVTSGDERARALAHLARCRDCRLELDQATKVVDELPLLAPDIEPPAGFETSVLTQLAPQRRSAHSGLRSRLKGALLQAAALAAVAGLAGGGVLWQTHEERRLAAGYQQALEEANGRYLVAADLTGAGTPEAGHVFAYEGSPSWIFLTVGAAPEPGPYDVRLVTRDGRRVDLGRLTVRDDVAAWGTDIAVRVRDVRLIQLVPVDGPSGTAGTMTARFDPG